MRGALIEPVKSHDSFLPHRLLGVSKQLHDLRQHRRYRLLVNQPADGVQGGADDEIIIRPQILLDRIDDQDDQIMVLVEEESHREIARPLERQRVVVRHLDGVDVAEGGVVAEHLHVDEADDVLLHLPLGDLGLGDPAL